MEIRLTILVCFIFFLGLFCNATSSFINYCEVVKLLPNNRVYKSELEKLQNKLQDSVTKFQNKIQLNLKSFPHNTSDSLKIFNYNLLLEKSFGQMDSFMNYSINIVDAMQRDDSLKLNTELLNYKRQFDSINRVTTLLNYDCKENHKLGMNLTDEFIQFLRENIYSTTR